MSTGDDTHEPFDDEVIETGQKMLMFSIIPSWMISFIGHVLLIILLAWFVMPVKKEVTVGLEAGTSPAETVEEISLDVEEFDAEMDSEVLEEMDFSEDVPVDLDTPMEIEMTDILNPSDFLGADDLVFDDSAMGELGALSGTGDETGGRSGDAKKQALKEYGGTDASEEAVQLALKWIIAHQLKDGGWNLDHRIGGGAHRDTPNPGSIPEARNGATALALLPLLGNGQTHKVGIYKDQVRAGLEFLIRRARPEGRGISFHEPGGTMYSHGLAAIVMCEAFAMSKDPTLAPYAQGAIWYLEDVQDPVGGGWRYQPRQQGDTSAVGWQIMALKSAKLAGLDVSKNTLLKIDRFLDNVSNTNGSLYGYLDPPTKRTRGRLGQTSIGLLCRMYLGWDRDTPGLQEGVEWMSEMGPSTPANGQSCNMYYNYYATQVMKHYGGDEWTDWNSEMRDYLVKMQGKTGNATGSWFLAQGHAGERGGRLYSTALCCMTLEVYYRYLPIYNKNAGDDDFKLE